jgi:hypothetical protein
MIQFLDGPAKGQFLNLERLPHFLRVVRSVDGAWDALDQLDDDPKPDESIYAYVMVGEPGVMHVDFRDKRGKRQGRWSKTATYRLFEPQPSDGVMRETEFWRAWCRKAGQP